LIFTIVPPDDHYLRTYPSGFQDTHYHLGIINMGWKIFGRGIFRSFD